MRVLFFLLLATNLGLAAYALLHQEQPNPDAGLLSQQLNAEQVRIIPPRSPAVRTAACIQWGSFSEADTAAARRALEALVPGERLRAVQVAAVAGWWVYIPPLKTRDEVERKLGELRERGVTDYFALEEGDMRYAISLGIFRTEDAAESFLARLRERRVRSAVVGQRDHRVTLTAFLVREPDARASARLAQLSSQFPGSELKAMDCPG